MSAAEALPQRTHRGTIALGDRLRWRGRIHQVVALDGPAVTLIDDDLDRASEPAAGDGDGERAATESGYTVVLLDHLVHSPGFEVVNRSSGARVFAPLGRLETVNPKAVQLARDWEAHIIEVHTGRHPHALDGSAPRPEYDPATRTLAQRYTAKAAELKTLGWPGASAATVERKRRAWLAEGLWGLVDDRRTRTASELGRADGRVVDLLRRLVERARKRKESVGTASRLRERLKEALEKKFPAALAKELLPPPSTFYALLKKLGIRIKDLTAPLRRQGDVDNRPLPPFTATLAELPGARVEIDTTGLDVLALGDDGRPVALELTIAIDVATRSLAGVIRPKSSGIRDEGDGKRSARRRRRRRGRATKGVDACLLLAQLLAPQRAARHWSPLARAENSDLPYPALCEADPRMEGAAARPVITPTMIVIDHGKVFTSQAFIDACTYLGITVRPARIRTPSDKAIVERTCGSFKPGFSQFLAGYTGSDLSRRGKGVEKGRLWRVDEINDLLQQYICLVWQQRPHEGLRNPFHPAMPALTPNQAYAAHVAASGYLPVPLSDADVLNLLPTTWARVTDKGIRFGRRTYDGPQLNPYRGVPSGLFGSNRMRWEVRYHPYQPEKVWLRDHRSDEWVPVDFIYKDLIRDPWTELVWEQATDDFLARDGRADDEEGIAREVSKLLRKAGRPPARDAEAASASWEETVRIPELEPADPYAGIPVVDPASISPCPTLDDVPAAASDADENHGLCPIPGPAEPPPGPRAADWLQRGIRAAVAARTLSGSAHALLGRASRRGPDQPASARYPVAGHADGSGAGAVGP